MSASGLQALLRPYPSIIGFLATDWLLQAQRKPLKRLNLLILLERVKGIEPSFSAWEADVLPLNYTRFSGSYVSLRSG